MSDLRTPKNDDTLWNNLLGWLIFYKDKHPVFQYSCVAAVVEGEYESFRKVIEYIISK